MISLVALVDCVNDIEPMPRSAVKLAEVLGSPNSTIDTIAEVIAFDQALTALVLQFANSVFSGSRTTVSTVREAVIRLGGGRILARIAGKVTSKYMKLPLQTYGYEENELWEHSVAAALAAQLLGSHVKCAVPPLAFTAALLHDFGKLLLARYADPDVMEEVWKNVYAQDGAVTCDAAEKEILGFSHADVGAAIASMWQLPEALVVAIRDHHTVNASDSLVTDCVKISNIVARCIGVGIGNEGMNIFIDDGISTRLGISKESFEKLCAQTAVRFKDVLDAYA